MSLELKKTPLGTAQGLGTAKEGTQHWWGQRVSAVLMIPLIIFLILSFMSLASIDHISISKWLQQPWVAGAMVMFVLTMFVHSELGTQTVVEDYAHGKTKVVILLLLKFVHILLAVIAILSILRIFLA